MGEERSRSYFETLHQKPDSPQSGGVVKGWFFCKFKGGVGKLAGQRRLYITNVPIPLSHELNITFLNLSARH